MSDGAIVDGGTTALLLAAGLVCALLDRRRFDPRWLAVAVALVLGYNVLLTNAYRLLPDFVGGAWNWQGMLLALAGTLAVAALPAFGWRRTGLTPRQAPGSLRSAVPVALVYCLYPVAIALTFGGSEPGAERLAFQATMPGLAEECFYRGVLLFALDRAFRGRWRVLGVDWGFGALLSCLLFGVVHAFGRADGAFTFDALTFALTAIPALPAVWLRYRTRSVLIPIALHNFGNSIQMAFP